MTDIASEHRETLFDGGSANHEVVERKQVPPRRLLALNLANKPRSVFRKRVDRNQPHEFFNVLTAALAHLRRLRAVDPMDKFGDAVITELESSTNPRRADSMVAGRGR